MVWVACRTLLSACARDTSGFPAAASDGDIHSDGGVASGIHANDVRLQVKYLGIVCLRCRFWGWGSWTFLSRNLYGYELLYLVRGIECRDKRTVCCSYCVHVAPNRVCVILV